MSHYSCLPTTISNVLGGYEPLILEVPIIVGGFSPISVESKIVKTTTAMVEGLALEVCCCRDPSALAVTLPTACTLVGTTRRVLTSATDPGFS